MTIRVLFSRTSCSLLVDSWAKQNFVTLCDRRLAVEDRQIFMKESQPTQHAGSRRKASTADIVGTLSRQKPVPAKWRQEFQNLLQLRAGLEASKGGLVEAARQEQSAFSLHMADAGTDQYDLDFALGMMSSEQGALYEIEEALKRIQDGTYGVCEVTGQPIEPERLAAIPWTRFSLEAQKQLEKDGGMAKAHVGARESLTAMGEREEKESDREEEE
jgi:RNA polymerase-binding transcription factor DksA